MNIPRSGQGSSSARLPGIAADTSAISMMLPSSLSCVCFRDWRRNFESTRRHDCLGARYYADRTGHVTCRRRNRLEEDSVVEEERVARVPCPGSCSPCLRFAPDEQDREGISCWRTGDANTASQTSMAGEFLRFASASRLLRWLENSRTRAVGSETQGGPCTERSPVHLRMHVDDEFLLGSKPWQQYHPQL